MRDRGLTRRVLLRGAAAGTAATAMAATAGCSPQRPPAAVPAAPDPDAALLNRLIADKERLIALYRQAAERTPALAAELRPFEQRHQAHLAELRRRLPDGASSGSAGTAEPSAAPSDALAPSPTADGPGVEPATEPPSGSRTPTASPSGSASPSASPSASGSASASPSATVARLRAAERTAASARTDQLASASPALAQLLACIGACEAAHAIALPSGKTGT